MREKHLTHLAVAVGVVATLMAGCTASSGAPTDDASKSPSSWSREYQIRDCMTDAGWEVEIDELDGSLVASKVPDSQVVQLEQDLAQCAQRYPLPELVISRENAELYYDRLVDAGECLDSLGFSVPEPPSREASVESMIGGNGGIDPLWDPYEPLHVGDVDRVAAAKAMVECPRPEWGAP